MRNAGANRRWVTCQYGKCARRSASGSRPRSAPVRQHWPKRRAVAFTYSRSETTSCSRRFPADHRSSNNLERRAQEPEPSFGSVPVQFGPSPPTRSPVTRNRRRDSMADGAPVTSPRRIGGRFPRLSWAQAIGRSPDFPHYEGRGSSSAFPTVRLSPNEASDYTASYVV